MKGKNTGNSLKELRDILSEIQNGSFDFDGCNPQRVIEEIKEDIELLSCEVCNGAGEVEKNIQREGYPEIDVPVVCSECNGSGEKIS